MKIKQPTIFASELKIIIVITAHLRKEERTEVDMNEILGAGSQPGAVSDVWSIWTDKKMIRFFIWNV